MNKRLRIFTFSLSILALLSLIILLRPRPYAVGFQEGSVNYPMMYAIEGGFFDQQGLRPRVRVFESANDALDAILGKSLYIDSVVPIQNIVNIEIEKPGSLGIFAFLLSDRARPLDYLVVLSNSEIKTAMELSGKTIVVFPGTYSETITRLALDKIGITNVKFIKRSPADMHDALQKGLADAGIFYDPMATQAQLEGWGRIVERGFWENYLLPVIVVGGYTYNLPEAKKNPDLAKRTFSALKMGVIKARENPHEAKAALHKYIKVPGAVIDRLPDAYVILASEIDPTLIDQTLDLYVLSGIIPRKIDLSSLLDYAKNIR